MTRPLSWATLHPMRNPFACLAVLLLSLASMTLVFSVLAGQCSEPKNQAPLHGVQVQKTLPHDPTSFTQGLFLHGGLLYESTGHYHESTVKKCDPETGHVLRLRQLPPDRFGEGLARLGNTAIQLSWKAGQGFIYDLDTLTPLSTFDYQGEGWGLATGPKGVVMSNGSQTLTFLDPNTLKPVCSIRVYDNNTVVTQLNELEWYQGLLLANIWLSDEIVAINPDSGAVQARIDLAPLRGLLHDNAGVANGIAYDQETDQLLVTGKNWDKIFEIKIVPPLN